MMSVRRPSNEVYGNELSKIIGIGIIYEKEINTDFDDFSKWMDLKDFISVTAQ